LATAGKWQRSGGWVGDREAVASGSFCLVEGIVGGAQQGADVLLVGGSDRDADRDTSFPSVDAAGRERFKYPFEDALGEFAGFVRLDVGVKD